MLVLIIIIFIINTIIPKITLLIIYKYIIVSYKQIIEIFQKANTVSRESKYSIMPNHHYLNIL